MEAIPMRRSNRRQLFRKAFIRQECNLILAPAAFHPQQLLGNGVYATFPAVALSPDFFRNRSISALCCHDLLQNIKRSTTINQCNLQRPCFRHEQRLFRSAVGCLATLLVETSLFRIWWK